MRYICLTKKKNMKTTLTLLLSATMLLFATSCDKDNDDNGNNILSCAELSCLHGGSKVEYTDGTCGCDCDQRYTGQDCGTDLCENFACENGTKYYDDGISSCYCLCDNGYYGDNCDQNATQDWVGTYVMNDNCYGTYTITISAGTPPSGVVISNFANEGTTFNIAGSAISANELSFSYGDGSTLFTGNLQQESGVYTFSYFSGNQGGNCQGSMQKQ